MMSEERRRKEKQTWMEWELLKLPYKAIITYTLDQNVHPCKISEEHLEVVNMVENFWIFW